MYPENIAATRTATPEMMIETIRCCELKRNKFHLKGYIDRVLAIYQNISYPLAAAAAAAHVGLVAAHKNNQLHGVGFHE